MKGKYTMLYYFILLVFYAVTDVLCAHPIWAFLGVTVENSLIPFKTALIVFAVVSVLMGLVSRGHYSYYFDKSMKKYRYELKGKMIRRYFVVMIAAFVISLVKYADSPQSCLADIKAGFGLGKAALFLIVLLAVGLVLCLGEILFARKPQKAAFESYGAQDVLSKAGKNYRKLTDEELFPALMKKAPSERINGSFAKAYREKALALGEEKLESYRTKNCYKAEEYESHASACRSAARNECWPAVNEWLNETLGKPEEVDSFPEMTTDLGKAYIHCSFTTPNEAGMAKLEAEKRAVDDAMKQWNEERDAKERLFNAALAGDLRTDEMQYLGGDLSESVYMEGKFQRDVAEAEARQKIESEIYSDEYDLTEKTEFDDQIPLTMDYFRSLGWYIDMVKADWDKQDARSTYAPRFYQMLWPVYVAGHKKRTKDFKNLKGVRSNLLYAIICVGLSLLLKLVSNFLETRDGIWVVVSICAAAAFLITAAATLFFLFLTLWHLRDIAEGRKDSSSKNVAKQARSCAPALYRQLRFYKLWKKDDPAVTALEEILDRYYTVTEQ